MYLLCCSSFTLSGYLLSIWKIKTFIKRAFGITVINFTITRYRIIISPMASLRAILSVCGSNRPLNCSSATSCSNFPFGNYTKQWTPIDRLIPEGLGGLGHCCLAVLVAGSWNEKCATLLSFSPAHQIYILFPAWRPSADRGGSRLLGLPLLSKRRADGSASRTFRRPEAV